MSYRSVRNMTTEDQQLRFSNNGGWERDEALPAGGQVIHPEIAWPANYTILSVRNADGDYELRTRRSAGDGAFDLV